MKEGAIVTLLVIIIGFGSYIIYKLFHTTDMISTIRWAAMLLVFGLSSSVGGKK